MNNNNNNCNGNSNANQSNNQLSTSPSKASSHTAPITVTKPTNSTLSKPATTTLTAIATAAASPATASTNESVAKPNLFTWFGKRSQLEDESNREEKTERDRFNEELDQGKRKKIKSHMNNKCRFNNRNSFDAAYSWKNNK